MNKLCAVIFFGFGLMFPHLSGLAQNPAKTFTYSGMCDGSAATAIDDVTFIVASDETRLILPPSKKGKNVLNVYKIGNAASTYSVDLEAVLQTKSEDNEADIEGSARIGNRIFWIASHGLNSKGKSRPDRLNFFATDIVNGKVVLAGKNQQVWPSYKNLMADLVSHPSYAKFGFGELYVGKTPPEEGGINIEGLAATPDGKLLIAFRSPVFEKKAVLAVLLNPNEVVEGGQAKFDAPIEIDLNDLGVRDIAYWEKEKSYLIIAGSVADSTDFFLYKWSGKSSDAPQKLESVDFNGLNPETISIFPNQSVLILSDDGGQMKANSDGDEVENKTLPDAERTFRSVRLIMDYLLEK